MFKVKITEISVEDIVQTRSSQFFSVVVEVWQESHCIAGAYTGTVIDMADLSDESQRHINQLVTQMRAKLRQINESEMFYLPNV